ncbi:MAG: acetyltransferase [Actinomycetia bacterium]|nr:acetyltransferase [Actinomycetes bacterium]
MSRAGSIRPLTRLDFPTLARWRRDRQMIAWWGPPVDETQLEHDHGNTIDERWSDEDAPARLWIYEVGGVPIGFGESYLIDHHTEYAERLATSNAIGVDYAIGEPAERGRGHGRRLVTLLISAGFAEHCTADKAVVVPKAANAASRATCESAGLHLVEQRPLQDEYPRGGDSAIYALSRVRFETQARLSSRSADRA